MKIIWFYENHHFMCLGKDTSNEIFIFKGLVIKNSKEQGWCFIEALKSSN